ncbi:MAG: alpha/beta hydrolase [Acidobacteria bacterium]|nr:alpha/beta hydrolase [Acidobacteriota bacterium]
MKPESQQNPSDLLCAGSGPFLVLIGGLHGHFEFQRPIAERLAADFQVFCPSLPGERSSGNAPDRLEDVAALLLQRLSAAGVDRFSLCGISMGGAVAMEMALQAPQRVTRLAGAMSFAEYGFLHPRLKRLFDFLLAHGKDKACRRMARFILLILTLRELIVERPRPGMLWRYWKTFRRYHSPGALVWKRLRMIRKLSLLDRLCELRMPVLLLVATNDHLVHPRHSEEMARRIPQAQVRRVAGSGHLFPFLSPKRFTDVLAPFLRGDT